MGNLFYDEPGVTVKKCWSVGDVIRYVRSGNTYRVEATKLICGYITYSITHLRTGTLYHGSTCNPNNGWEFVSHG